MHLGRSWRRHLLHVAVSTPSPSGEELAVVERLSAALAETPVTSTVDGAGNLLASRGSGDRRLYVLGHVDTFPEPLPCTIDATHVRGRGAVDAKGPLCAALSALATVDDDALAGWSITIIGAVGEEAPGSVGARHAVASMPAPDLLVIAEPSGVDAITLGYRGQARLRVRATRPTAHAAGPDPSAADLLVATLADARRALEQEHRGDDGSHPRTVGERHAVFDAVTLTITDLRTTRSSDEESAEADVQVRLPVAWSPERLQNWWSTEVSNVDVTTEWADCVPAVRAAPDSQLHRAFRAAIRLAGGSAPRHTVKTGTSDWNVVHASWPVPTLAYGPGDASLDHTAREALAWAEYDRAVDVWNAAIGHLSRGLGGRPR